MDRDRRLASENEGWMARTEMLEPRMAQRKVKKQTKCMSLGVGTRASPYDSAPVLRPMLESLETLVANPEISSTERQGLFIIDLG